MSVSNPCRVCQTDIKVNSYLCRHEATYCQPCLKSLPNEAKKEDMPFRSSTCNCVYCDKACQQKRKCTNCGGCACDSKPCRLERNRGEDEVLTRWSLLCKKCHIAHTTCGECRLQKSFCLKECAVCKHPTCDDCLDKIDNIICGKCAAKQNRMMECWCGTMIIDRRSPADRCSICSRALCGSINYECAIDDCKWYTSFPEPKLCCKHFTLARKCQNCNTTGTCPQHRIPCETCGRSAMCFDCCDSQQSLWDSHWTTTDPITGICFPQLLIQCRECQAATRETLKKSELATDLQKLLYRQLFDDWK